MKNKKLFKVLIYIILTILFFLIGILFEKNFNNKSQEYKDSILKTEKISVSTFIINNKHDTEPSYSSSYINTDVNLINTFEEIINSKIVKDRIREDYSKINDIELEYIDNTSVVKVIYTCGDYTEKECKDINNKFVSVFKENVTNIYNINNISVVDSASISTRIIE